MNKNWLKLLIVSGLCGMCWLGKGETIKMTGLQLKACSIALVDFTKAKDAPDLTNFTIEVVESKDSYQVIFIPNQVPGEATVRGGATKYGKEVHYVISKDTGEIIRKFFAR